MSQSLRPLSDLLLLGLDQKTHCLKLKLFNSYFGCLSLTLNCRCSTLSIFQTQMQQGLALVCSEPPRKKKATDTALGYLKLFAWLSNSQYPIAGYAKTC